MGFDMDFLIVSFWVHFQFFLCEDVAEILVSAPAKDVADVSDPSGAGPTLLFSVGKSLLQSSPIVCHLVSISFIIHYSVSFIIIILMIHLSLGCKPLHAVTCCYLLLLCPTLLQSPQKWWRVVLVSWFREVRPGSPRMHRRTRLRSPFQVSKISN